jgi:GT2 family glycosyltransferase
MYTVQKFVFPHSGFDAPEDMYVRIGQAAVYQVSDEKSLRFCHGGKAEFGTFYNAFSVGPWKTSCALSDLYLTLVGEGEFTLSLVWLRPRLPPKILCKHHVSLKNDEPFELLVDQWKKLEDGILYFELVCIGEGGGILSSGGWGTSTPPLRDVRLGVVVTHFNRKDFVIPAISRIKAQLLEDPDYRGCIDLFVVDNSNDLAPGEVGGATILPNKNYGGASGFTKGLLHLEDEQTYSHCLFMDDDASCEVESIRRAYRLFQYVINEKSAVAGSLLREVEPYRLFEKGARFDGFCRPLKSGLDMRNHADLAIAEINDIKPDYGGWWFFGFKISEVVNYAFPFFVRGDDIMFGMTNDFDIITMNGIACWGEDFGLKSGPLPIYLDVRNHFIQKITHMKSGFLSNFLMIFKFFAGSLLSYNYATAKAVVKAVKDVSEGPSFWLDNMDASRVRKSVGAFSPAEKMQPIDRGQYDVVYGSPFESRLRKFFRIATLNGFLLPGFMLKDGVMFQHKSFRGNLREIFRYKRVLYEYEPTHMGYVAEHSKKEFFSVSWDFVKASWGLMLNYRSLQSLYNNHLQELTSRGFWVDQLSDGERMES